VSHVIYLDHAATTPLSDAAWAAMEPFLRDRFGNPSEPHAAGRAARAGLETARGQVAEVLGIEPADVVFCGGGTEADNLAVAGRLQAGGRVVASAIEHPAVREPLRAYAAGGGEVVWVPVDAAGAVDLAALSALLRPGDALCCVMWANNVTGVIQPVDAIAAICTERGVPLHVDAVQAAGGTRVDAATLGAAGTLALAAHKLGGPKGAGVLAGRGVRELEPVLRGGGQEAGIRPGTENVAGAAGLAAALAERQGDQAEWERRAARRARLEAAAGLPVAGAGAPRLPGHSLLLTGVRGDSLVVQLDADGICVAAGSACAAGTAEPSYVLAAMGIDDRTARGALRITQGPPTTDADVDALLDRLAHRREALALAAGAAR
jgi:cysteine desulfurase